MPIKEGAARWAYGSLLRLLSPLYLLKLHLRGRAEPLYRHAMGERFGFYRRPVMPGALWLHAVSLGETRAAQALVQALREAQPGMRLLLTHGTATGLEAGRALLREGDQQTWLPFDTPGAVHRFLKRYRPQVGVLMETEIWPNLLHAARVHGVPMVLANARLSEKSRRQGDRFAALLRPAARALSVALAQTEADAQRLTASGVAQVQVCGNLKFDLRPDEVQLSRGRSWRARMNRPVTLMASSREGEEEGLLDAWQAQDPATRGLLLLVPRHPQRFDDVAAMVRARGLVLVRRSSWGTDLPDEALTADVCLGDSMGEMAQYYAASDVALLGGSFAPLGGQNLIEAAACACPIVLGPHTFNFAEAAELSLQAGASKRVADIHTGVDAALSLVQTGETRHMAEASLAFAAEHQGAAKRMALAIVDLMTRAGRTG